MVVRQDIEGHGGDFRQQLVEGFGVRRRRDVVAMPAPDGASSSQAAEIVKITGFGIAVGPLRVEA
jgi:hypothetical protein